MENKIQISTRESKIKLLLAALFIIITFYVSALSLELDLVKFSARLKNVPKVLSKLMTLNLSDIGKVYEGMFSSILIAVSALFLGLIISVILSFLAADTIAPNKVLASIIKGLIAIIRAVPALVWILMVVASYGFGNTGGMVGLIFPTVGYLVKSFTSSIEDLGIDLVEAMRSTGANRFLVITKALIPTLLGSFLSWTAIRLEGNIAESISLGMVGIGGIGSLLTKALGKYEYGTISMIILVIFSTMFLVELAVNYVRKSL